MREETERLYQEAMTLDQSERATLAALLIASLDRETDEGVDEAWGTEIARRVADLEAGRGESIPWEDVLARLRETLNAHERG